VTKNRIAVLAAPVLALTVVLAGCSGTQAESNGTDANSANYVSGNGSIKLISTTKRTAAPAISGTTLTGGKLTVRLKGKVTVLNFWASWCSPCRAEATSLEKVYRQTAAKGVQFVGVDTKDATAAAVAFTKTFGVTYPSIFDQAAQIALEFRNVPPDSLPSTLVIDRTGKVAALNVGSTTYAQLYKLVNEVSAEK
jgi:thiol-disulfide isomerase/thioredoxin